MTWRRSSSPPADTRHGHPATRNWAVRRKLLTRELQRLPKPLAVFSYNDCVAADIIDACEDAGLLVPEAVAVMGVDNDSVRVRARAVVERRPRSGRHGLPGGRTAGPVDGRPETAEGSHPGAAHRTRHPPEHG
jgi:hypothetical protein